MKFLLLTALACLVSAAEEPLPFSGNFNTIYLASKYASVTEENSEFRILMREVKYFKNYTLMSLTFYVRKDGKCQIHTVWANKLQGKFCFTPGYTTFKKCTKYNGTDNINGKWTLRDANLHFLQIYHHPGPQGGVYRRPSQFSIHIHFVSNTNILFFAQYLNTLGNKITLTAALARGTNVTAEVWEEYVKLTRQKEIPINNIENVYEADACPKWEH